MKHLRSFYGDRPPDGDIALAYYQTLYGTNGGKETAVLRCALGAAQSRGCPLCRTGPSCSLMSQDPREGIRILQEHSQDASAQTALRQAIIWDSANPASAAELREYLKEHPQDTELENRLKENETKLAQMNSGIARTPAERAAFAALNAHKLDEAQKRFTELLEKDPPMAALRRAWAFCACSRIISAGRSATSPRPKRTDTSTATSRGLVTSRFWYMMGEATEAFNQNQIETAPAKYKEAGNASALCEA